MTAILSIGEVFPVMEDPNHPWDYAKFEAAVDELFGLETPEAVQIRLAEADSARTAALLAERRVRTEERVARQVTYQAVQQLGTE